MTIQNIIIINGKEYDFEELSDERKKEVANALNERALATLNYEKVKTA